MQNKPTAQDLHRVRLIAEAKACLYEALGSRDVRYALERLCRLVGKPVQETCRARRTSKGRAVRFEWVPCGAWDGRLWIDGTETVSLDRNLALYYPLKRTISPSEEMLVQARGVYYGIAHVPESRDETGRLVRAHFQFRRID